MSVSIEEAKYFNQKAVVKIREFITKNPDFDHGKDIGIIKEPDGDFIWYRDWHTIPPPKPVCTFCGKSMSEGSIRDIENIIGFPYWFCGNDYCEGFKLTNDRQAKEIDEYRNNEGEQSYFNETLHKMNIPKSYHRKTLSNLKINSELKNTIRKEMKNQSNLLITGKTGSGKTHLSISLLIEYGNYKPYQFRFENMPDLFNKLQYMIKEDDNYIQTINELQKYNTLVLDDLGADRITDYRKEVIYDLISSRIFDSKQTIITTNLTLNKIKDIYSERLSSRLSEYKEIRMDGKDYRRKKNE